MTGVGAELIEKHKRTERHFFCLSVRSYQIHLHKGEKIKGMWTVRVHPPPPHIPEISSFDDKRVSTVHHTHSWIQRLITALPNIPRTGLNTV